MTLSRRSFLRGATLAATTLAVAPAAFAFTPSKCGLVGDGVFLRYVNV